MKLIRRCILIIVLVLSCSPSNELQGKPYDPVTPVSDIPDSNPQSNGDPDDGLESESVNLLFVGNSLTYTNNLPELVEDLAKTKGKNVSTKMIALPNYAIIDHLDYGNDAEIEIRSKKYDYVIIQQGPSSQSEGRRLLFEGAKRFNDLCKQNESKLVIFMVWPSRRYYYTFDGVILNHTEAARAYGAILCPVGTEWKRHFDSTGDFSYYGSDQFHPSLKGSEEAARIILNTLFKVEDRKPK